MVFRGIHAAAAAAAAATAAATATALLLYSTLLFTTLCHNVRISEYSKQTSFDNLYSMYESEYTCF